MRLVSYVPDNVLAPLISGAEADNYFMTLVATREDEAVGTLAGAYMGGLRGVVMMQTSGFALIANALASLIVPYQIPAIIVVSERGTLGEFNVGQATVARTMRPVLDSVVRPRQVHQAGFHHPDAGGVHPLAAPHRRQSARGRQIEMKEAAVVPAPIIDAPAVSVLNRADLTRWLVAKLSREEAVVAGIGNTNFDLYAAGHRPQNFYMLGSMGLACPIAQPERGVIALEGDGSILMALGCLATIGMVAPRNLTIIIMDNGIYQITGKQKAATAGTAESPAARE